MPQRALSGIHPGSPWPLGSSLTRRGVNFVLAAPGADRIELLLYSNGNDRSPERVIELDGRRHRSGDYWHCLLYTSPSPRDGLLSRMPSSA
jgi:isoamylase